MIVLEMKCPKCGYVFVQQPLYDFEKEIECKKCQYYDEAWNFPHRPIAYLVPVTIEKPERWETGDHYTNDALCLELDKFMKQFNREAENTHGGLINAVIQFFKNKENGEKNGFEAR